MYSEKVIPIIKEAGKNLLPFYGQAEVLRQKDDSPCNVVTELDLKTEKFLADNEKIPAI